MDEILAKAGSQAVTFAIKSGVSLASTYAIKTITGFILKIPRDDAKRIERLKVKLQDRIEIVSYAIDLIRLVAARGNTNLESTLRLTKDLKDEIDQFDDKIKELTERIEGSRSSKAQNESIKAVESYIKDLLDRIEEITPFINLSLTTSGANLSTNLANNVSPGLLLSASNYIIKNNEQFKGEDKQVGPSFEITYFSVFYHLPSEKNQSIRVTWKEDIKRGFAKVIRKKSPEHEFEYKLRIEQTFDDERYHNTEDGEEVEKIIEFDICQIVKLFFSVSGKLLKLEERDTPVLVLKTDKNIHGKKDHDNASMENIEWFALGQYDSIDDSSDDEEDKEDSSSVTSSVSQYEDATDLVKAEKEKLSGSISLLEYIIRLVSLQYNDETSILDVKDERLSVYLHDENPNAIRSTERDINTLDKDLGKVTITES
ncbi:Ran-specific GTPase-activating protein 30 [Nakaseomyces bracarensis]|uniref:Ran-specific GTPase-activating protein 30 n=1 Tax=Nakaseomyces bracarensis TaxID=273131 RepID=A0ABR4NVR3_9SACH